MKDRVGNSLVIAIYLCAAYLAFVVFSTVIHDVLGAILVVAGAYGVIKISKKQKFLF